MKALPKCFVYAVSLDPSLPCGHRRKRWIILLTTGPVSCGDGERLDVVRDRRLTQRLRYWQEKRVGAA